MNPILLMRADTGDHRGWDEKLHTLQQNHCNRTSNGIRTIRREVQGMDAKKDRVPSMQTCSATHDGCVELVITASM